MDRPALRAEQVGSIRCVCLAEADRSRGFVPQPKMAHTEIIEQNGALVGPVRLLKRGKRPGKIAVFEPQPGDILENARMAGNKNLSVLLYVEVFWWARVDSNHRS